MTRQDVNAMIMGRISQELRDQPNVAQRIGIAFNAWFQQLVAPVPVAPAPAVEPEPAKE